MQYNAFRAFKTLCRRWPRSCDFKYLGTDQHGTAAVAAHGGNTVSAVLKLCLINQVPARSPLYWRGYGRSVDGVSTRVQGRGLSQALAVLRSASG